MSQGPSRRTAGAPFTRACHPGHVYSLTLNVPPPGESQIMRISPPSPVAVQTERIPSAPVTAAYSFPGGGAAIVRVSTVASTVQPSGGAVQNAATSGSTGGRSLKRHGRKPALIFRFRRTASCENRFCTSGREWSCADHRIRYNTYCLSQQRTAMTADRSAHFFAISTR